MIKSLDFDYELPRRYIAQEPREPRDHSKLMVLDGENIQHRRFYELIDYFDSRDVLVLNDTRVLPARLKARKSTGGRVELLIMNLFDSGVLDGRPLKNIKEESDAMVINDFTFECLVKGKVKAGTVLEVSSGMIRAKVVEHITEGRYLVRFEPDENTGTEFGNILTQTGEIPLPPYIKAVPDDPSRYQTVYSRNDGSIAAPTAGLHFTAELIDKLKKQGVRLCYVTLHISYGTFKPVRTEDPREHNMDVEYYRISPETANILNESRKSSRITAVGTTCVRVLETIYRHDKVIDACEGTTDMFIYPGHRFKSMFERLITNFHFPRSTLLMLVSAFTGTERILNAYEVAKEHDYRFFSFGDAMLILQKGTG